MVSRRKSERCYQHIESETGVIRKNWLGRISIALVYPNQYAVGLPNLGFQTVYRLLNSFESVVCERVFLPETPGAAFSIESGRSLTSFDIIAFSVSFELDYIHLLTILNDSGIPLLSSQRQDFHPLVIAGGVACFINPEPVARFIDCFFLGEAELLLHQFISCVESCADRKNLLHELALKVQGAYVPSFYDDHYTNEGHFKTLSSVKAYPEKILRIHVPDLNEAPTYSSVITPHSTFANIFLVEVGRGCTHGCRFCSAGFVYRPPRFRSLSSLEKCVQKGAVYSKKIGLVGAAVSDLPDIGRLCEEAQGKGLQFSFSSLRADALTPELISALSASSVRTATIAPDAGSERMRRVINKGMTESQILDSAASLIEAGIPNLKLYFMIGLPTETMEDIEAIVVLCKKIKSVFLEKSRIQGHIGEITISINAFIPKPFTPFQWAGMEKMPLLKKKLALIIKEMKRVPNVSVESNNFREAVVSALLSRGDRRVSGFLIRAVHNNGNLVKTLKDMPEFPVSYYVHRERPVDELLPWDHIDNGINKKFLVNEYLKALEGKMSQPCPMKECRACGACD